MSSFIPIILAAGLISFAATPLVVRLAQAIGFVDQPSARKSHAAPTPMLGGIAIYAGLAIALVLSNAQPFREVLGVLGGMTLVTLVGLWDDRYGTPPLLRVLVEAAAAGMLIVAGVQVSAFPNDVLNITATVLWVIAICNAINFQDNMDGLAAGLAAVAAGSFFMLAVVERLGLVASLAAALLGASVGFLYYNFSPASLFMGDTGSLLIGFVLAVLGIKLEFEGRPTDVTFLIPIIILGLPLFDAALVVISRIRRGVPVYQGGRDHTSHRLVSRMDMSHSKAVLTMYMAAFALGLLSLMLRDATLVQAQFILGVLGVVSVGALWWLDRGFSLPADKAAQPAQKEAAGSSLPLE